MRLSHAAAVLEGVLAGADVEFTGCGIDSRVVEAGALFVALRGPHFDGHDFIEQARAHGAAAALVERGSGYELPLLRVADTRRALGRLAASWRARFTLPVIGITGSNGKTTVKEMLAAILRREGAVLASPASYNNDIGLPLTLVGLSEAHRAAVVELGANRPGEIACLAALANPQVGVITQCGPAHLEGFRSIEGVARAKGELLQHLDASGTAVINADDAYADLWREMAAGRRVMSFGLDEDADVTAEWRSERGLSHLELATPAGPIDTLLHLPGRHNVLNALAAACAALAVRASPSAIAEGLAEARAITGRLQEKCGPHGARILDDTYNANPLSLSAGIEVLVSYPGRHWLVLGDMGELGEATRSLHEEVARRARGRGVERLYAVGELSRHAAEAFGDGASHFEDVQALTAALQRDLVEDVTVLVKGSRAMQMERVVASLMKRH
ncbi:MAG: UDP-N-acetylmuramoyl-tripeptide--D-alanyl-D-alanine ligase [Gammaproteobacteria bacterium]|nr:UDP-N-acetylmuramoyl-tripeptide--D-alanyl-D-alanine ligase [Gammaproteobacteria bacterium]NIR82268.1 UDP-N-acetylmuramoyl-tripeptide--D-alanyl-D-alanine ligase [Gammaproteobacteria bacterium]NIR91199.1 UDP-N-acetylmuramoyl-tripeptide--D-alanyl-D-alanine ligase [Gammaproteobacteria bacterium]NIU03417.1 UDP-N-acetylmuramoyl-tripeptide--D-alanyl-D-alanine ligase [Gammaproteobacteria bacterium]NIX84692.1 UDP-N-acetylmuramoyl-tripeptide--D-alanyl-D-alanine ligase [Gammaproteobacteria bacterium]